MPRHTCEWMFSHASLMYSSDEWMYSRSIDAAVRRHVAFKLAQNINNNPAFNLENWPSNFIMENDTARAPLTGAVHGTFTVSSRLRHCLVCGGVWWRRGKEGREGRPPALGMLAGWDEDSIRAELQKKTCSESFPQFQGCCTSGVK